MNKTYSRCTSRRGSHHSL